MKEIIEFDMNRVPLEGTNLIEASAGTGKTYSVAMLVLRLIVEKNISIQRILMVTFTNAAVEEMALRIRYFIQQAIDHLEGHSIKEAPVQLYLDEHLQTLSKEDVLRHLKTALSELDEASIQTIHSFCQDALNLFAFETGQSFGLTLTEDTNAIVNRLVREYWRNHPANLKEEIYFWCKDFISFKNLLDAVNKAISGQKYYPENIPYRAFSSFSDAIKDLHDYLENNRDRLVNEIPHTKISRFTESPQSKLIEALNNTRSFYAWIKTKYSANYKMALCDSLLFDADKLTDKLIDARDQYIHYVINDCVATCSYDYYRHLKTFSLLTYDQMIERLADALTSNTDLVERMAERYDAVFIDEFQDTDARQFDIYNRVFGNNKILFYIGDPKQSIYGWRKADLNTYFKAAEDAKTKCYSMKINYRSGIRYVEALNHFFKIEEPFLTDKIQYINVSAKNDSAGLQKESEEFRPITIFRTERNDDIPEMCSALVFSLLNNKQFTLNGRAVQKSDIGILVRGNKQVNEIAGALQKLDIKTQLISDENVYTSPEAEMLEYILETVLNISWRGVNKALMNSFTGFKPEDLKQLDPDNLVDLFKSYQEIWTEKGTYTMVRKYMFDFEVFKRLTDLQFGQGLRILSNLNLLLEALQEAAYKYELSPSGVLRYLKMARSNQLTDTDEGKDNEQVRIESEEPTVTVMTIHKAKGLEFPIVIAPYLDLNSNFNKKYLISVRDENGDYRFFDKRFSSNEAHMNLATAQLEEENRRLLYVALTRAKYQSFLIRVDSTKTLDSTLNAFIQGREDIECIESNAFPFVKSKYVAHANTPVARQIEREPVQFTLSDLNWKKMSYSSLALKRGAGKSIDLADTEYTNEYDRFVFEVLPKGAKPGSMLHDIFEYIDFTDAENHQTIARNKLLQYFPQYEEAFIEQILVMLNHVTRAEINLGGQKFSLSQIGLDARLAEMEFDMFTPSFLPPGLMDLNFPEQINVMVNHYPSLQVQGLVNGFIDLFFEYRGKFYILDWKSNYLGNTLDHYTDENLMQAMNESNYHLQYLLYTCAVVQYLQLKMDANFDYHKHFGGVIYIFLRGARAEKSSGIFTQVPEKKLIDEMINLVGSKSTLPI